MFILVCSVRWSVSDFSHSKIQIWGGNLTNLAETLKIVGPRRVYGACFFQFQGPLAIGGARVPSSTKGSGEQDCQGKGEGRGLVEPWFEAFVSTIF